jgi:Methyltransferase domain
MFHQTRLGRETRGNRVIWKDNFSTQADSYAKYRPHYPVALYDFLRQQVKYHDVSWDCGTGNGQVATELAKFFKQVWATDASYAQLIHAPNLPNVNYSVALAENSGLATQSIDLITVAQAVHWFDFDSFYREVHRVARQEAIIALWGYGLLKISNSLDEIIGDFYYHVVDQYWDAERKHLDHAYQTISFPFKIVPAPTFTMSVEWNLADLLGYLATWSSVQKMLKIHQVDPVAVLAPTLANVWGDPTLQRQVVWDIYLKVGEVN